MSSRKAAAGEKSIDTFGTTIYPLLPVFGLPESTEAAHTHFGAEDIEFGLQGRSL